KNGRIKMAMQKDEIIIKNAIVHILETNVGMPVLSQHVLERHEELNDLLRTHIYKVASGDDLKNCVFGDEEESEMFRLVKDFSEDNLVGFSREAAIRLYDIMRANPDIPSADFCVVTFQCGGKPYLALLKMNYKDSFVHMTQNADDGSNYVSIIMQTATLPAPASRLTEAVIIDLGDYTVRIVEKKYEVNGVNTNYLSELYLKCHAKMSQRTRMKIVEKAVDQINHKYFEDNIEKQLEAKAVIESQIREEGAVTPAVIGEKLYDDYPVVKEEFEEKLGKYNMMKEEVRPQNEITVRKLHKQYLKTDTGIEINIPMDEYNNNDSVEFITNPDGTISIMIKNINRLIAK
ncbi:MAG: nucleoid-associated protein, partial [Lachnospiraceae bacterium]|nr:nucleoid-associated protein [Lachnospiraceae bacterium]